MHECFIFFLLPFTKTNHIDSFVLCLILLASSNAMTDKIDRHTHEKKKKKREKQNENSSHTQAYKEEEEEEK